jgi:uncharacterized membrane protein affecting hemolysin expression
MAMPVNSGGANRAGGKMAGMSTIFAPLLGQIDTEELARQTREQDELIRQAHQHEMQAHTLLALTVVTIVLGLVLSFYLDRRKKRRQQAAELMTEEQ